MLRVKRRRTLVRIISFLTAAFVVTAGLAATGYVMAYNLRMNVEYSYERSLSDLSDHMDNINLALEKAKYAGSASNLESIIGQLRMESAAAKTSLSQIYYSNVNMDKTSKFLSQVSDYAASLEKSLYLNKKLSDTDYKQIAALAESSKKLSQNIGDIVSDVQLGRITVFKSDKAMSSLQNVSTKQTSTVESGFQSIEDSLSGLPSLIYDGPFSDNVLKKNPEVTKGKKVVSREDARKKAAEFLRVNEKSVADDGESNGNLPTYNFKVGTKDIDISKNGGIVVRMIDSRSPSSAKLTTDEAVEKANAFFSSRNINNLTQTYFLTNNNICVINCAYMQDKVTCYTDLIKIGIALDTGEVASYDATGYIMNHKKRDLSNIKITQKKAQSVLNPQLTVKKVSLALIPRDGTKEALCYEFKCTADNGKRDIIDYINASTGVEEQLLILTKTPGGTLAM
jgi:spore germination protein